MANAPNPDLLTGVIEGFYGKPWSETERLTLFDWMAAWGLNTYLYAPKDDLKHRAIWRELYSPSEAQALADIIRACHARKLRFIYALSPGLDLRYREETDLEHLRKRFDQLLTLGAAHFALLFDDIPDRLDPADTERWGSLAAAQSHVANTLFRWTRERAPDARFLFCPTPYCGRMAGRELGGPGYLATVGRELLPGIDVFWTGPEIISREITVDHIADVSVPLQRKPLLWDNLQANDYDGRRFYCGPYAGRPLALRQKVSGFLLNPNNEFPLNYVPIRTLAGYLQAESDWDPRAAYELALREWLPSFEVLGKPLSLDDLTLLTDCYYLPYEEGPRAQALLTQLRAALASPPTHSARLNPAVRTTVARLRDCCARLAGLKNRDLFYALSRRLWELREELDLLDGCLALRADPANALTPHASDFHLPLTYRGGMVPRLQSLLRQMPNGTFIPSPPVTPSHHE